jgi:hypothetical protein
MIFILPPSHIIRTFNKKKTLSQNIKSHKSQTKLLLQQFFLISVFFGRGPYKLGRREYLIGSRVRNRLDRARPEPS